MKRKEMRTFLKGSLRERRPSEGPAALSDRLTTELLAGGFEFDPGERVCVAPDFSDAEVMLPDSLRPVYATDTD